MTRSRRGKGKTGSEPGSETDDGWSPYYGAYGMVFDAPSSEDEPEHTRKRGSAQSTRPSQSKRRPQEGGQPGAGQAQQSPLPDAEDIASDSPPEYPYGPSAQVYDLATGDAEPSEVAKPPKRRRKKIARKPGAEVAKGNVRPRWPLWTAVMVIGIVGAAYILFRDGKPKAPLPPDPHWVVALTKTGDALLGRTVETGYGTVSVRIDVVSTGPASQQWHFLVACPAGKIEYRSGDRWADAAREYPLGLVDHRAEWEPEVIQFACNGKALEGPISGFEPALSRALDRLNGKDS